MTTFQRTVNNKIKRSTKGLRNCKIESRNCKLKQIKQVTQTWIIFVPHSLNKKFKLNDKSRKVQKTEQWSPKEDAK